MTLDQIRTSEKLWLTPCDVAPVLQCDPNLIRWQAHNDPDKLGFPVTVLRSRVKINRVKFLEFLGEVS